MPNHITNILTIKGSNDKVLEVINILLTEDGNVTFNKFAPMPNELKNVSVPTKIVSKKEYNKAKKELDEKLAKGEDVFMTTLPLTNKKQKELINKYNVDNWYDWAINNWGSKWGAYDGNKINNNTVFFLSAWSTPFNGIITLSNMFPDVQFVVDFADENIGYNVGQYTIQNGIMISEIVIEEGSLEAIKMSMDIVGSEQYYLGEMFYDLTEEDINFIKSSEHDYYDNFITLVVERENIDENYPLALNKYLLEIAVENEQYEYAIMLRDIITDINNTNKTLGIDTENLI
jgi:hypothetical protein